MQPMVACKCALNKVKGSCIAQENAKARKARTKRLIEIGAAAESILGRPFQDNDLQKFLNFLKQQETNGNYYSKAMNNTDLQ